MILVDIPQAPGLNCETGPTTANISWDVVIPGSFPLSNVSLYFDFPNGSRSVCL